MTRCWCRVVLALGCIPQHGLPHPRFTNFASAGLGGYQFSRLSISSSAKFQRAPGLTLSSGKSRSGCCEVGEVC
eukprot:4970403-Alexandrium_andersonii.AAC.1